jgi:hypothetical protein
MHLLTELLSDTNMVRFTWQINYAHTPNILLNRWFEYLPSQLNAPKLAAQLADLTAVRLLPQYPQPFAPD